MVCGRRFGSLNEFLKLAPEHIVHLQFPGNLFRYVQPMGSARVEIHLLQNEDIRICICEEIDDLQQPLSSVDVPIDNAQRTGRPDCPAKRREVAGNDFLHCHIYTLAAKVN